MVPLAGVDPSTGKVQLTRDIIKRNIQVRRKTVVGRDGKIGKARYQGRNGREEGRDGRQG
jgi:hypothetical protein